MSLLITLDSSVIIAALRKQEDKHIQCRLLLEEVKDAQHIAIQSYIVLVEVVAAIKRRTNSDDLARKIGEILQSLDTLNFVELEGKRANVASDIAIKTGLRGMDAIIVQIAEEFDTTLISLDDEMMEKAKSIVKVKSIDEFK